MQNLPLQSCHGELLEVKVTGGHELAAAASDTPTTVALAKVEVSSCATAHGATVGAGRGTGSSTTTPPSLKSMADDRAARPDPEPVSYVTVSWSNWLVNVNFGHTFSVESNVPPE